MTSTITAKSHSPDQTPQCTSPVRLPPPLLTAHNHQGTYRLSTRLPQRPPARDTIRRMLAARAKPIRRRTKPQNKPRPQLTTAASPSPSPPTLPSTHKPPPTTTPIRFKLPSLPPHQIRQAAAAPPSPPTSAAHQLMHSWHLKLGHMRPGP